MRTWDYTPIFRNSKKKMTDIIPATSPLEEALNTLNLDGCLVLSNLLLQKAIYLKQQEDAKGKPKILKANDVQTLLKS